ncbi:MAG: hypothetical protein P4L87_22965 [Formivibrio sp.]|nr:hypothetical protein [Formivibrio sp.]
MSVFSRLNLTMALAERVAGAALLLMTSAVLCQGAAVLLVARNGQNHALREQVDVAARFYGLDVRVVQPGQSKQSDGVVAAAKDKETVGVILDADALPGLDRSSVLSALLRTGGRSIPAMIFISSPDRGASVLARWFGTAISGCKDGDATRIGDWQLQVSRDSDVARELAGVSLPYRGHFACGLELAKGFVGRIVTGATGAASFPTFIEFGTQNHHMFAMTELLPEGIREDSSSHGVIQRFSTILPVMVFIRNAAGDRAWHMPGSYANLTIDDPWLARQYGNLNYLGLFLEMEKHKFHTSIGFIPWNFDRSDHDVVELFRAHPDRFSVCIHGDDHNHAEFGNYSEHPFEKQAFSARQALARMEEFKRRTGIPYDQVMVFPHSVAPQRTFHVLRTTNYWATVNSDNVPLAAKVPDDPLFLLRPETLAFENILSIKRYSCEVPVSFTLVAINAYLGNPNLFYAHQQFFSSGIGAFNDVADKVNRMAPATEWRSLGYITQHLYLMRRIEEQVYDILALSPVLTLASPAAHRVVLRVRRPEDLLVPIRSVRVDGKDVPYQVWRGELNFDVVVDRDQVRRAEIIYGDGLAVPDVSIARASVVAAALRRLSDLRDMTLSTSATGRRLIAFYTAHPRLFAMVAAIVEGVVTLLGIVLGWIWFRKRTFWRDQPRWNHEGRTEDSTEIT